MRYERTNHQWAAIELMRPSKPHGVEHGGQAATHRGRLYTATILAYAP